MLVNMTSMVGWLTSSPAALLIPLALVGVAAAETEEIAMLPIVFDLK
jgi:hypothetical protein